VDLGDEEHAPGFEEEIDLQAGEIAERVVDLR